jgi:hypothetical protein
VRFFVFNKLSDNLTPGCAGCFLTAHLWKQKTSKMKKTLFTLLVVLGSMSAFAQFEQGTMLVGGDFGLEFSTEKSKYNNQTNTEGKGSSFTLEPQFGYFVIDNLAVGGELGVSLSSWKPEGSDGKSSSTTITIAPFVRYYFEPGVFLEGKYAIGSSKFKDDYFGDVEESKYGVSGWSLGAGYAIFLNDNVALEPMLGYQSMTLKNKTSGEPEVKGITSGLFARIGFQIYLR